MDRELEGKVAIITGASQGIGRAMSLALSQNGVNVVLAARNEERLAELQREIAGGGAEALVVKTDVKSIDDCKHLTQRALDVYGQIDILVNSAGLGLGGGGPIELSDPVEVADMVQVNVLGIYHCTYAVLPTMKDKREGYIINISSVAGITSFPASPMYAATKAAVKAFSDGLRNQVQDHGIRVTTVYPGQTDTPMLARFSEDERGRFLKPEEVAKVMIHVLSYPKNVSINEIVIRPTWQRE